MVIRISMQLDKLTRLDAASGGGKKHNMPKRHDKLFQQVATFDALYRASKRAIRGKRNKAGAAAFQFSLERELLKLEIELESGTYRTGRYLEIELKRPKKRIVSAAPFRDRVVQNALVEVIGPLFEAGFIDNSFANRIGKGTHRAIKTYERYRNRYRYVLRCDVFRYFPAIDHEVLKCDFRRRISCQRTLELMDVIVDGSNPQEPVDRHFQGDDLLTPLERTRGLPIGNLMSQFSANLYLDPLDHYASEVLAAPYLRYVDDFALFHDNPKVLSIWRDNIASFIGQRRLQLHQRKTKISPTEEASEFLGIVLHRNGKRSLPEKNVKAFKGRLKGMVAAVRAGTLSTEEALVKINAWAAHARHTNSRALRHAILARSMKSIRAGPDRSFARTA